MTTWSALAGTSLCGAGNGGGITLPFSATVSGSVSAGALAVAAFSSINPSYGGPRFSDTQGNIWNLFGSSFNSTPGFTVGYSILTNPLTTSDSITFVVATGDLGSQKSALLEGRYWTYTGNTVVPYEVDSIAAAGNSSTLSVAAIKSKAGDLLIAVGATSSSGSGGGAVKNDGTWTTSTSGATDGQTAQAWAVKLATPGDTYSLAGSGSNPIRCIEGSVSGDPQPFVQGKDLQQAVNLSVVI